jgi:adenosylcobinamide-phosphate synthase
MAGALSTWYERLIARALSRSVFSGVVFWFFVNGTMLGAFAVLHCLLASVSLIAAQALDTLVIYQSIAATDLAKHVRAIVHPLQSGDIRAARSRLAWIVGRDTEYLDEAEISRAAIESVAESTTDGVISPLFWAFVLGAPGALLYRTSNTLDSTVGHRTPAYEKFGKASARIDDVLNWLPSRICAFVFWLLRFRIPWNSVRLAARKHASPNAGWSEAAMAYALGVKLGGDNFYDGERISGPVFNSEGRTACLSDIEASLAWMWRVVAGCTGLFMLVHWIARSFSL